jgi:DNA-binding IclR family transcriptional regulator
MVTPTPPNSLEKMLSILDIVEDTAGGLSADDILGMVGLTRSTLYRYLKVLTDAGLLTSLPDVGYTLGPRIVELDYKMRMRDPLITASRPVMQELVRSIPGIALLCRKYKEKVLCVHQEAGTDDFHSNYERGHARPLLKGAASRIILAHTPTRSVTRIYEKQPESFAEAGFGQSLTEVKTRLARLRQAGFDMSSGQITPGVTGVAAPLFDSQGNCVGSLALTLGRPMLEAKEAAMIAERVTFCAGIVSKTIAGETSAPAARKPL